MTVLPHGPTSSCDAAMATTGSARCSSMRPRSPDACGSWAPRSRATIRARTSCSSRILKGAVFFMADLARAIDLPLEMDFLAISSYLHEHGQTGSKAIRFLKDLESPSRTRTSSSSRT